MKIFDAENIRKGDKYTIEHEPVLGIDLMERAARRCASSILADFGQYDSLIMLCGTGNNGGDGLVIARVLRTYFSQVTVFCVGDKQNLSPDFSVNYSRIAESDMAIYWLTEDLGVLPSLLNNPGVIVGDALLGSGLNKPIADSIYAKVIEHINHAGKPVFSVDMPSGLFADSNRHIESKSSVVKAVRTYTFEQPKLSFLFAENNPFTGEIQVIPIGIHPRFKEKTHTDIYYVTAGDAAELAKPVNPFSHKGTFGHSLLIGGSVGKSGAIALSARASVKSGSGLTSVILPEKIIPIIQGNVPEAMCIGNSGSEFIERIPVKTDSFSAVGIGPGLGTEKESGNVLKNLITGFQGPKVLDADALNLLSENKTWLRFLNSDTVLTPHPKEFDRMTGTHVSGYERWKTQVEFSKKMGVYVILKGRYTQITTPFGKTFFNSSGNPGMATGGSGDVLTGLLTGLLAQGFPMIDACLLGVYLHGLAGDIAFRKKGREALTANDIIESFSEAFKKIHELKRM